MNPFSRALNVLTQPRVELTRAAAEPTNSAAVIGGYAAIFAALPFIGRLLSDIIDHSTNLGSWLGYTIGLCLLLFLLRDLGVPILVGLLAGALAPNFGGMRNPTGAMKLVMYAGTPVWLMTLVGALLGFAVPVLGVILVLIGFGYAGFLLYLGCRPLLAVPDAQAPAVAGILTAVWLVLYFVVAAILVRILYGAGYGII